MWQLISLSYPHANVANVSYVSAQKKITIQTLQDGAINGRLAILRSLCLIDVYCLLVVNGCIATVAASQPPVVRRNDPDVAYKSPIITALQVNGVSIRPYQLSRRKRAAHVKRFFNDHSKLLLCHTQLCVVHICYLLHLYIAY